MANALKFGNKVVFLNGIPLTLPIAASDPGSATAGDLYYNSVSNQVRFYDGSNWGTVSSDSTKVSKSGDTMSGALNMGSNKITNLTNGSSSGDAVNKGQLDSLESSLLGEISSQVDLKVSKDGDTMSGALNMGSNKITNLTNGSSSGDAVNKGQLDSLETSLSSDISTQTGLKVSKSGDTMSGALNMGSNKITNLTNGSSSGDAVNKGQLDLKADLDSPALTGTPTAPTQSPGDNSTNIATTAYADAAAAAATPNIDPNGGLKSDISGLAILENGTASGIYTDGSGIHIKLESSNPTLKINGSNELGLKSSDTSFSIDGSGVSIALNGNSGNSGLNKDSGGLYVKVKNSSGITLDSDGLSLTPLTANKVLISDVDGLPSASSISTTTLEYLDATSSVQTQLDNKANNADVIKKNGSVDFTADQSLGGFKLTNVHDPESAQDAATKAYVDGLITGLSWKQAVHTASIANVNIASAPVSIDNHSLSNQDRVLLKDQSTPSQNGIYVFNGTGSPLTRSTDMDTWSEVLGSVMYVQEGDTNGGSKWVNNNVGAGTIGVTAISFAQFSSSGSVTGTGVADQVAFWTGTNVLSSETYLSPIRGGLGTNASSLTGVLKFNSGTASASSIVNADISGSAAIAQTKMASLTANRVIKTDSSGYASASSVTDTELNYVSGVTSAIQTQLGEKANTALSNLASTALNVDLLPSGNLVRNIGSNTLLFSSVFASTLDGYSSTLNLKTSGSNASIVISANGSGNLDIETTKIRRSSSGADVSNFMEDQYHDSMTLSANVSVATAITELSFPVSGFDSAIVNYKIKEGTKIRVGQLIVTSDGTIASSSDQYSETATLGNTTGLSLSADISSGNVRILYNNTNASTAATMRAHVRRLRA